MKIKPLHHTGYYENDQVINAGGDVEKRESLQQLHSFESPYGKQYIVSSKIKNKEIYMLHRI